MAALRSRRVSAGWSWPTVCSRFACRKRRCARTNSESLPRPTWVAWTSTAAELRREASPCVFSGPLFPFVKATQEILCSLWASPVSTTCHRSVNSGQSHNPCPPSTITVGEFVLVTTHKEKQQPLKKDVETWPSIAVAQAQILPPVKGLWEVTDTTRIGNGAKRCSVEIEFATLAWCKIHQLLSNPQEHPYKATSKRSSSPCLAVPTQIDPGMGILCYYDQIIALARKTNAYWHWRNYSWVQTRSLNIFW